MIAYTLTFFRVEVPVDHCDIRVAIMIANIITRGENNRLSTPAGLMNVQMKITEIIYPTASKKLIR